MKHLIAGQRDPKVLATLARSRAKISKLEEALGGAEFFTPEHAALLASMLARIDRTNAEISKLTQVIEWLLAPYEEQLQQAESMPGWSRRSAQDALAETGVDMSRFPTGGHLASWADRTPLDNSSGKRTGHARPKKGNRYLAAITGETAVAVGKTQTREGTRYRRLARCRGKAKAQVALGNTRYGSTTSSCPPRAALSGPRPRLLPAPVRHPPPDRPPRRQARRPRLRSHPLPHPPSQATGTHRRLSQAPHLIRLR
jgi:transposase